ASQGTHVCLWDVDQSGLGETADQCGQLGVDSIEMVCDLSSSDQISSRCQELLSKWPEMDILVNNAGVGYEGPTQQMSSEQWNAVIGINLLAPIQITHLLLPTLLSRPEAHILNVSSMLGLCPAPRGAAYCTSKYGLVGLSESLRIEYRRTPLGVTAVCPGFVRTRLFENGQGGDRSRPIRPPSPILFTSPERVAKKAVRGIRRNRAKVLVTPLAHLVWFLNRYTPSVIEGIGQIGRRKGPQPLPQLTPHRQMQ
ncbi:MAG: SDR family oxidoreductase, partial [Pirellulales bacterium]|nr:SDR family oxidoreductase [Pirellulales bacterium]